MERRKGMIFAGVATGLILGGTLGNCEGNNGVSDAEAVAERVDGCAKTIEQLAVRNYGTINYGVAEMRLVTMPTEEVPAECLDASLISLGQPEQVTTDGLRAEVVIAADGSASFKSLVRTQNTDMKTPEQLGSVADSLISDARTQRIKDIALYAILLSLVGGAGGFGVNAGIKSFSKGNEPNNSGNGRTFRP
jgi:hypothetical protein